MSANKELDRAEESAKRAIRWAVSATLVAGVLLVSVLMFNLWHQNPVIPDSDGVGTASPIPGIEWQVFWSWVLMIGLPTAGSWIYVINCTDRVEILKRGRR